MFYILYLDVCVFAFTEAYQYNYAALPSYQPMSGNYIHYHSYTYLKIIFLNLTKLLQTDMFQLYVFQVYMIHVQKVSTIIRLLQNSNNLFLNC